MCADKTEATSLDILREKRGCFEIIQRHPKDSDALHLLGVIASKEGDLDLAITAFRKAIDNQDRPVLAYYFDLGVALQAKDHKCEETAIYCDALKHFPRNPELYFRLGHSLHSCGCSEEALKALEHTLELQPDHAAAHAERADVLFEAGKLDEAYKAYVDALRLKPYFAQACCGLGRLLEVKGEREGALACLRWAITSDQHSAEAHFSLACLLARRGELNEAVRLLRRTVEIDRCYESAYHELATILRRLGYRQLAEDVIVALGVLLDQQGRFQEAHDVFAHVQHYGTTGFAALLHMGIVDLELGHVKVASETIREALTLEPANAYAHFRLAHALLRQGDFERGWAEYEWRFECLAAESAPRLFPQPFWDGSPLNGRTILLHSEQGLGDAIQFVRYTTLVKSYGGMVILQCRNRLVELFKSVRGADRIIDGVSELPHFDVHAPLLSVPRILGTVLSTIPREVPYLTVDPELIEIWRQKVARGNKLKVGIVWAGGPFTHNNCRRSIPLHKFGALTDVPGLSLFSLQRGSPAAQLICPPDGLDITNVESSCNGICDTAAIIMNLDLVVSVDTMVAHLAGALGQPVWVLLPFASDWRYLTDRFDMPWYPTMRLFRQPRPGDWASVMEELRSALCGLAADLVLRGARR